MVGLDLIHSLYSKHLHDLAREAKMDFFLKSKFEILDKVYI